MTLSQIKTLVAVVAAALSLTSGQERQLDGYARMRANQWIAERRSEAEVELYLREEGRRVARG